MVYRAFVAMLLSISMGTCFSLPALARESAPFVNAKANDEPYEPPSPDEPGIAKHFDAGSDDFPSMRRRFELGFGYSSLLVDPDVAEGIGGGLFFSWEFYRRIGAELTVFVSKNPYEGTLGDIGANFILGNITLGPSLRLSPPNDFFAAYLDLGLGTYVIVPYLLETTWTLGMSGGVSLLLKVTRWFGISIKLRYHLFNLATIAGPDLRDLKALMKVGVADRFEIPLCLAFMF